MHCKDWTAKLPKEWMSLSHPIQNPAEWMSLFQNHPTEWMPLFQNSHPTEWMSLFQNSHPTEWMPLFQNSHPAASWTSVGAAIQSESGVGRKSRVVSSSHLVSVVVSLRKSWQCQNCPSRDRRAVAQRKRSRAKVCNGCESSRLLISWAVVRSQSWQ